MSIDEAAFAVMRYRTTEWKVRMVAIAGCESGYDRTALGDAREDYPAGSPLRTTPYFVRATYRSRAADWTSVGLWQVNMHYHSGRLRTWTGSDNPQIWAYWLMNPDNAARAADAIYGLQGYAAWTCYTGGGYRRHLVDAWLALDRAVRLLTGGRESLGPVPEWVYREAGGEVPPPEAPPSEPGAGLPPDTLQLLDFARTLRDNPRDWLTWWLTASRDQWQQPVFEVDPERLRGTLRTLVDRPGDWLTWWLTASLDQWYPAVFGRLAQELVEYARQHPEVLRPPEGGG